MPALVYTLLQLNYSMRWYYMPQPTNHMDIEKQNNNNKKLGENKTNKLAVSYLERKREREKKYNQVPSRQYIRHQLGSQ